MKSYIFTNLGLILGISIPVGIIVLLVIILLVWWFKTYNRLVEARNRTKNQWAQIDVQLKRRFDLIPNLVETIKGYSKHESEILTQFANARKMYAEASKNGSVAGMSEANSMLGKSLNMMVNAVSEQYPEIKADVNYNNFMTELRSTEDKIAHQRQFYNDTVNNYNNLVEKFPSSIVANKKGFKLADLFKVEEEAKVAPKVSF